MEVVDKSITEFIREIIHGLEIRGAWDRRLNWFFSREASEEKNVESYLEIIFELKTMVEFNLETLLQLHEKQLSINVNHTRIKFKTSLSFYYDTIDIIPTYRDAALFEDHKPLVLQKTVPSICYPFRIPDTKEGVRAENHNFGCHFRYCKTKKRIIERTNLLLAFDPIFKKTDKEPRPDLFSECHAEGKDVITDMETIGDNR